jgi:hypothetical protein
LGEWEPKCEKKLRKPDRVGAAYRRDGDLGVGIVAFGTRPFLFGYDPKRCAETWQAPIAFDDEPMHPNPHLMNRIVRGRVYSLYQLASGRWVVGARNVKSGHVDWYRSLPEAERGTNVEALFVSAARVYVARDWRLDVLDLDTGGLLGWI